ncbi:hypothetical protein [Microlunatus soli]|uniref:Uncharacterized protein n=1 Tax=Microlunatus soli TaxID=630515 RepID=A0A1H2A1R4_9ACTN|nr:hypothetical protein [Microlunatus soli]SDT39850.1 hypothetical protein SAMN04489812_5602 [Microlunatus soli]
MKGLCHRFRQVTLGLRKSEAWLFLAYVTITFRPGAAPPAHPQHEQGQPDPLPDGWGDGYQLYIDEARLDSANQLAEKRDIRARAQVMLTTAIVLGGAIIASYGSKCDLHWLGRLVYGLAGLCTTLAGLAAGGMISARSDIGTVNLSALPDNDADELRRAIANGYASTRRVGAETIATLVTALRDCVLVLVIGAGLLAVAHLWL